MPSSLRVFPCLACNETINNLALHCPFCAVRVDPAAAEAAADALSKVNQACSDASYLMIMGTCMLGFVALRAIPFLGGMANIGFLGLLFAVPFMSVRWWAKFRSLPTADTEFARARRTIPWIGIASIVFLLAVLTRIAFFVAHGLRGH